MEKKHEITAVETKKTGTSRKQAVAIAVIYLLLFLEFPHFFLTVAIMAVAAGVILGTCRVIKRKRDNEPDRS